MKSLMLLTTLCLAGAALAGAKSSGRSAALIKPGLTMAEVAARLGVQVRAADREAARSYVLPEQIGKPPTGSAGRVLAYLVGTGWDGSKLPVAQRKAGLNYELARTPHVYEFAGARYLVCNNRMWDWTTEGKQVVVVRRVKDDGDLTVTKKVRFDELDDDLTLRSMLDEVQRQTGVAVHNLFGNQHVPSRSEGLVGKGAQEIELPMTAASLPPPLRQRLKEGVTVGEFLSIVCLGLNRHTQKLGGDWKWSSAYEGRQLVYTLRDYAHLFQR